MNATSIDTIKKVLADFPYLDLRLEKYSFNKVAMAQIDEDFLVFNEYSNLSPTWTLEMMGWTSINEASTQHRSWWRFQF